MSATPITDAFEDRVVNGTETRAPLVRPLTNTIDYCAAYGEAIEQMEELELELQAVKAERGELALKLAGAQCYIEEQKKLSAAPAGEFAQAGDDTPLTNAIVVEGRTQEDIYRLLSHARKMERALADAQWALRRDQAANKGATDEIARLLEKVESLQSATAEITDADLYGGPEARRLEYPAQAAPVECDCDQLSEVCKKGRKRVAMTCGYSRCTIQEDHR